MAKFKIERTELQEIKDGKVKTYVRHNIYKRYCLGWKYITYKPSPSLARQFMRDMGVREWLTVDLTK